MTKGKNSQFIEHCFTFRLTLGRASNEITQMLGIRKMLLWLFYVLQRHVVVWTIRIQRILFSRRAGTVTKSIHQSWSFRWIIVCNDFVLSNQLKRDKQGSLIRNQVLRDQKRRFKVNNDSALFIVIPSCDVFLWVTCHSQRKIYACLFNFDKIRTLLCHRRKVLPHSSTEYYSQLPLLYWAPFEDGNNKKQLCGLTGRLMLISLYHNVNVV